MNYQQLNRYYKINEKFYLLDNKYIDNTYNFYISGSTKNVYTISITNDIINCNCPDSSSYAKKYNVICKHCCFVLFKVLKVCNNTNDQFYKTYKFTNNDMVNISKTFDTITYNNIDIVDNKLLERYKLINNNIKSIFDITTSNNNEECPICYDLMNDNLLKCPNCKNYIHKQCMEKWLELKNNCVYCRSDIWNKYYQSNNYLQL